MFKSNASITELIEKRFSCRDYLSEPVSKQKREQLQVFIEELPPGPFGSRPRFDLLAADETDRKSLRGLGTYGFIKNPPAFIIGAMPPAEYGLEDYGYLMESIILFATSIDLGTCWLGGTFTKSRFARKINLSADETMPAIVSVGEFATEGQKREGWASRTAGSHRRLPWETLFFKEQLEVPISQDEAGEYATVLEMIRLGPSASNKQPWRILRQGAFWRFYLQRTPGYGTGLLNSLLDVSDLQRVDMGIAMCQFEQTANQLGLEGEWVEEDDLDKRPAEMTEYLFSWNGQH